MIPVITKFKNRYNFSPRNVPGLQLWLSADRDVKSGNAAQFTAANSEYLSIADNSSLSTGNIDFSAAAWVYADSFSSDRVIIGKLGGTGWEWGIEFSNSATRFRFNVSSSGTAWTANAQADNLGAPSTGTWYFIVGWHDSVNDTINIQVNNGTTNSTAYASGLTDSNSVFALGTYGAGLGAFWNGRITGALFSKRVWTADERTWLYNGGTPRKYNELGVSGNDGSNMLTSLISCWELEEDSGTRSDKHGTNTLTDNNTVTGAAGPALLPAIDGDPVRQWTDLSGKDTNVTQTTGNKKPTLSLNSLNGKPGITFDGTDDSLTNSSSFNMIAGSHIFAVVQFTTGARDDAILSKAAGDLTFLKWTGGVINGLGLHESGVTVIATENVVGTTAGQIAEASWDGATPTGNGAVYRNGALLDTGTYTTADLANNATLIIASDNDVASGFMDGKVYELLIFNRVVSLGQRNKINRYLGRKYGIVVS